MRKNVYLLAAVAVAVFSVLFSVWISPAMPDRLVTHWGINGNPNGFSDKSTIFVFSLIPALLLLFFYALPRVDPLWNKYGEKAREKYWFLLLALSMFFLCTVLLILAANIQPLINVGEAVSGLIGFLFICLAYYFSDCKPSWFVGVRTPWAMMSEDNWARTHEMASKVLYFLGVLFILSGLVGMGTVLFVLALAIAGFLAIFVYSYYLYRKETAGLSCIPAEFMAVSKPSARKGRPKASKRK